MSEVVAAVAVHSASTSATSPRVVSSRVDAVAIVVSWSLTTGCTSAGNIRETVVSCSDASAGVFTAPYTDSAVTSTGAIDKIAKNAMPALSSGSRAAMTRRPVRRRTGPHSRAGISRGAAASCGRESSTTPSLYPDGDASGAAERLVPAEVSWRGTGVPLQSRTLVVRRRHRVQQPVQRIEVACGGAGQRLLDEVVAGDVGGVGPVHRLGVRTQGEPPRQPGIEPRQIEEKAARRLRVSASGGAQCPEEAGPVDPALAEQPDQVVDER